MNVLYISYDGLLEPLGRSQVICYVRSLAARRPFHLISFEKSGDLDGVEEVASLRRSLASSGVEWHPLRYHKSPTFIATAWDILTGTLLGLKLCIRYKVAIVHARGYVPSVMALVISSLTKPKFLFDMRGFWADEKLDGGWSRQSRLYRLAKWFERLFLLSADHVISLTEAAIPIVHSFPYLEGRYPPITVIPTCTDLEHFSRSSIPRRRTMLTVGYVGTASNWYLFDRTAECFAEILKLEKKVRFLIVNRNEHDFIREKLMESGVPLDIVEIISSSYEEMPQLMARMDVSIYFIKPVFSKMASSPTKLGELLGCGVPCMTNRGVGDVESIFDGERIGVLLGSFNKREVVEGLIRLLRLIEDPYVSMRCRVVAEKYFSLIDGVRRYNDVYESLDHLPQL